MAVKAPANPTWHRAKPAPVVLISGPEDVLAGRAIELISHAMRDAGTAPTMTTLDASAYRSGDLLAGKVDAFLGSHAKGMCPASRVAEFFYREPH